jgi:hypothetical protein
MKFKIPKIFHSDSDKKAFKHCKVCQIDLSDGKTMYTIEKAYKKTSEGEDLTLFEIAICMPCAERQAEKMSNESKAFLQKTMMNEDFMKNRQKLWDQGWEYEWDKRCIFSGEKLKENEEYHVVGHFQGSSVIPYQSPFVIGEKMIEYVQENLSPETKQEMDDFGGKFLGPDPKIAQLLEEGKFLLV